LRPSGANGVCSTANNKVSLPKNKKSVTYTTTNVARAGATWDGARWAVTLRLRELAVPVPADSWPAS